MPTGRRIAASRTDSPKWRDSDADIVRDLTLTALTSTRPIAHHKGFDLRLRSQAEGYRFEVEHAALVLHESDPSYRTPVSAVRAARLFIDDALRVFDSGDRRLLVA